MRLPGTVIGLGLVSLFTDFSSEMIYPLLPVFLTGVLGAGPAVIGAIEGTAETVAALLKLMSGWWSDRLPQRKPLVLAGYGLASVVRPLVGLAQSIPQVAVIRVLDRFGKGVRGAPRDALIADAVAASDRGRAFGFQRAMDHAGAFAGPLAAFVLLSWAGMELRTVFLLAALPAALAMLTLILVVREPPRQSIVRQPSRTLSRDGLPASFWRYLVVLTVFALGNSTDALLILRATELGVTPALIPVLWAVINVVKSLSSTPGGILSDRWGRRPLIVAGWAVYSLVYLGFATASAAWHAWMLFGAYGLYFGMTEGVEKAMVADLVGPTVRGAAYGWYSLALGFAALPASLLTGFLWQAFGARTAFLTGAALALTASLGLLLVATPRSRQEPAA